MVTAWSNLGNKSFSEFAVALSKVEPDLQDKIIASITKTQGLTPAMQQAWTVLALTSKERFNETLSTLPEDVQGQILASVIAVNGMNETNRQAYEKLSQNAKQAFNNAMNGMDTDARNRVQSAINEINGQSNNAYNAGKSIGSNANAGTRDGQGNSTQLGRDFGNGYANGIWGVVGTVAKAARNMANSALTNVALAQNSHSPSKKTRKLGNDNGEGLYWE